MDSSHYRAASTAPSTDQSGAGIPEKSLLEYRSPLRRLVRSIGWTMVFKLTLLTVLYVWFFGPAHRLEVTPERLESHMLAPTQPTHLSGEAG